MIIHQDCYSKYYTVNFYEDHIEIQSSQKQLPENIARARYDN